MSEFVYLYRGGERMPGSPEQAQQQMQIEALTAGPQKVNEQLALSKPAPQLVANP